MHHAFANVCFVMVLQIFWFCLIVNYWWNYRNTWFLQWCTFFWSVKTQYIFLNIDLVLADQTMWKWNHINKCIIFSVFYLWRSFRWAEYLAQRSLESDLWKLQVIQHNKVSFSSSNILTQVASSVYCSYPAVTFCAKMKPLIP